MPPASDSENGGLAESTLDALRADPARGAVLSDIDGTLAPIAERPEEVVLGPSEVDLLKRLSARYALVGCVSGRRAEEARRLVGVEEIVYAGNHGLELLLPGDRAPRLDPKLEGREH
ncbi:MAG: trehalose-phosphatase, partial [Solirubrobacterales bacterium]